MQWSDIVKYFVKKFPNMTPQNSRCTSVSTEDYNCIAWAWGRNDVWCWPDKFGVYFWPIQNRSVTIDAFIFHVPGLKPPPLGGQLLA